MNVSLRQYAQLLIRYLRPQSARVLLLAGLLGGSIGLQLYNPRVLQRFIDMATGGAAARLLVPQALLFVGLAIVNQALAVSATYTSENVGWTATNAMRNDLVAHCLGLDMSFHKKHSVGELIERVDGDVTALANFFSQFIIQVLGNLVLLIGVLVVLWQISRVAGAVMSAFAVVALIVLGSVRGLATPYWQKSRQAVADWSGYTVEHLSGTEDIRSSGAVPYALRGFIELHVDAYRKEFRAMLMGSLTGLITLTIMTAGQAASLVLAGYLFRGHLITLGTAYIVFHYGGLMFRPLNILSRQMEDLQLAGASIQRIRLLDAEQSVILEGRGEPLPAGPLAVEFCDVTFGYDDEEAVLHNISLHLQPGRALGLLGRTGSGKTTLTRLLFRLYDPTTGTVRLNGVDLRDARLSDLKQRVAVVTQDVQLFEATVRDNLTFFDPSVTDEEIHGVLAELGMDDWLATLPQGLDTELASEGNGFSAGEAQMLALARVFLKKPGVVILDEASSRLDAATEQRLERAVDRLLRDCTGIIVAHRLATVQRVDEIMILQDGRVVEQGVRGELAQDPNSRFAGLLRTGLEEALA
jgi:ATP-binding cassette, subfamily B, bacterial